MFVELSCIIVDGDAEQRQELSKFLAGHGVQVVGALADVEGLPAALGGVMPPQLAIVNIDPNAMEMLERIRPLVRQHMATSFLAMSGGLDAAVVMEAMHVGCKDFITLPVNPAKLVATVERIAAAHGGASKRAKLINFIPTTGGCGATTIACNVASFVSMSALPFLDSC